MSKAPPRFNPFHVLPARAFASLERGQRQSCCVRYVRMPPIYESASHASGTAWPTTASKSKSLRDFRFRSRRASLHRDCEPLWDGKPLELFLNNHKHGNQVDTNARDAAIALSFALQCGADAEAIRKALYCDSRGRPLGPLGAALDLLLAQASSADLSSG